MREYAVRNRATNGLVLWWKRLPGGGYTSWGSFTEAEEAAQALHEEGGGEYDVVPRPTY